MGHLSTPALDTGFFSTAEVGSRDEAEPSISRTVALPNNHYQKPPNLAAGFRSLEISCEGPIRANLVADSITTDSFRIAVETWGGSRLFEASATWIEHKADARDCVFGQFDTQDASDNLPRAATAPDAKTTRKHLVKTDLVPKKYGKVFEFPREFKEPPQVVCWLNRLDLVSGDEHDYKLRAFADDISTTGFSGHLDTWDDGEVHGAAMCWIAFRQGKKRVDSGRFSTTDVRRQTDPRERTTGKVEFPQHFEIVPTVLAALDMIDAAGNADLRIKVSISEVDRTGFRWTLETWDDSTLYAAGASWIALGFR